VKAAKISIKDLIIYEDDNYFLVNKPPFLSTLEDRNEPYNLLKLAREYEPDAQVCHRLDKDTSRRAYWPLLKIRKLIVI
jgi:23S rRNA-/tRNA-specific pseudouridylate synthase